MTAHALAGLATALLMLTVAPALAAPPGALQRAAYDGDVDRVRRLLGEGAAPGQRDAHGHTPLMRAAQGGHVAAARALLEAGAEVDAVDGRGYTALIWACQEGQAEVAEALLEARARIGAREAHGFTPLMWAVRQGHAEVARRLLARGANPLDGVGGTSAIALAARHADPAIRALFATVRPAPLVRWRAIGTSVSGHALRLAEAGEGAAPILVIAAMHGDEPQGPPLVHRLLAEVEAAPALLAGTRLLALPVANPDGLTAGTPPTARGVDLNRNFPARWRPSRPGRLHGGPAPLSEPESRALLRLIEAERPRLIVALHAPLACTNFDGAAAEPLAAAMASASGYRLRPDIGYETPGSLGHMAAGAMAIPVITLELGPEPADRLWSRVREALLLPLRQAPPG